jgi:hypothetical protein
MLADKALASLAQAGIFGSFLVVRWIFLSPVYSQKLNVVLIRTICRS